MKTMFSSLRNPRGLAGFLAMTLGLGIVLQVSAPPSGAGFLGPSTGAFAVTYGRTAPTDVEASWASRGSITITRTSRGNYTIVAPEVTGQGNPQLTVLGPGAPLPLCSVIGTSNANPGTKLKVRCWSATTGKTSDAGFTLLYTSIRNPLAETHYSVLTTNKSNRSHTPTNQFRAEPGAAPLRVTRLARGAYTVIFPNESFPNNKGILFVSATRSSQRYCNLAGWFPSGSDVNARVDCYSRTGARADSLFTLTATETDIFGEASPNALSLLRNAGTYDTLTDISGNYHWSGASGTDVTRDEFQPGRSTIVGDNLLSGSGAAVFTMVSGFGFNDSWPEPPGHDATNLRCSPGRTQTDLVSGDATFEVQCFTPAGYPVNASYTLGAVLISLVI
ncbi:unannotated protein [freshwater metagenome]